MKSLYLIFFCLLGLTLNAQENNPALIVAAEEIEEQVISFPGGQPEGTTNPAAHYISDVIFQDSGLFSGVKEMPI